MPERGSSCDSVLKSIRKIIRAADLQSKVLMQSCGLTSPQLLILREVQYQKSITTSEVAEKIDISQSTATIIIDTLVKKDLVVRTRDTEDKRKWFISLTNKGVEIVKDAPPLLQSDFIKLFDKMPNWEQNQMLSTLQRVVAMLNAQEIDSSPIISVGDLS